jgi:hypothetical protein
MYTPLLSFKSTPSSVHPEHANRTRTTVPHAHARYVSLLTQPALRQSEREDVVNHSRPELRVRHERREAEHSARERRHTRVRRRVHANRYARAMGDG